MGLDGWMGTALRPSPFSCYAGGMKTSNRVRVALELAGAMVLVTAFAACEKSQSPSESTTGEQITLKEVLSPVEQLVLKLVNSGYTRGLDQNDYYLSYRAAPPETVVIVLKHVENGESKRLKEIIESAKGVIQRMATRDYGMRDLKIEVESTRLPPEEIPERLRKSGTSESP